MAIDNSVSNHFSYVVDSINIYDPRLSVVFIAILKTGELGEGVKQKIARTI